MVDGKRRWMCVRACVTNGDAKLPSANCLYVADSTNALDVVGIHALCHRAANTHANV